MVRLGRYILVTRYAIKTLSFRSVAPNLMLVIIRFLAKYIRKEHLVLSRYDKSHPHFKWFLGLDAVLSVLLVFGGLQFAASSPSTSSLLKTCGVTPLSVAELTNYVKDENKPVYWLGPMPGNTYTINNTQPDTRLITYLPACLVPSKENNLSLTVETYNNLASYMAHMRPLTGAISERLVTAKGATVEFDKVSMNREIVTFKDRPEIVVINYPTRQTAQAMMKDADSLKLIWSGPDT